MSMSIPYMEGGRTGQKARTRHALVTAARELLADGHTPTVESAAARAGISRATAYRYFLNQRDLLVATHPMIDMPSLLEDQPPDDPVERVLATARRIIDLTVAAEPELRMSLRMSLEPSPTPRDLPLRTGRRIVWFHDALASCRGRYPDDLLDRLALALAAAVGLESYVWLIDVAGQTPHGARDLLLWTARQLTSSTLA